MTPRFLSLLLLSVASLLSLPGSHAAETVLSFSATVEEVRDDAGLLEGALDTGSILEGGMRFGVVTPAAGTAKTHSAYLFRRGAELVINGGTLQFASTIANPEIRIEVSNDERLEDGSLHDAFLFRSSLNDPLKDGVTVSEISWQLDDPAGQALDSKLLPTTLDLTKWQPGTNLIIRGENAAGEPYAIRARVTAVQISR